jgi:hypothetical protein
MSEAGPKDDPALQVVSEQLKELRKVISTSQRLKEDICAKQTKLAAHQDLKKDIHAR